MTQQLIENTTGYYSIDASMKYVLPFECVLGEKLVFTAAHSNFFKNQNWSMRFWISKIKDGVSITQEPQANLAYVNPLKLPVNFGVYDVTWYTQPTRDQEVWLAPVAPAITYYLNIQNLENRPNGFYLVWSSIPID
jgi:hypothetical protein